MKIISSKIGLTFLAALSSCALAIAEDAKPAAATDAKPADAKPADAPRRGRAGGGDGARRGYDPEARLKEMQTSLGLSEDQTAKVKAAFEKGREKNADEMKKLREDTTLSREDKRKKMGELMAGTNEEVKAILTPDQQTKYKEMQDKRREEFQKRREGGAKRGAAK